jgi:hypothetical protein
MHGWIFKKDPHREFEKSADIRLFKGKASSYTYGPGTYFGDVVLKDVLAVQRVLRDSAAHYVLFAPEKDGEHIKYKIFVSREEPMSLSKIEAAIATTFIANPSPPKSQ